MKIPNYTDFKDSVFLYYELIMVRGTAFSFMDSTNFHLHLSDHSIQFF